MTTGFTGTFTLNSPLTDDDWDKITDVDFDNTYAITFHTKHGKEVEFVKAVRWIPVSERLPDADSWAIWCSKNGVQQIARLKTDAIDHFFPSQGFFGLDDAAAWMPLPEPYEVRDDINK